tara:strand:+ start:378 stop:1055 length:678 start_codon:yes stop_codon:yes gene_type:complete
MNTCSDLIKYGNYKGDICLVIDDDLVGDKLLDLSIIKDNNIIIKHFEKITIPQKKYENANYKHKVDGCSLKFNLFKTYFKKWDFIFYMDCGIHIYDDISPIINEAIDNKLLAHSDAYPTYEWKLRGQFNEDIELNKIYNLDIDYFQSTILLFDTNIIEDNTFTEIIDLVNKYPTGRTNDQCYLSLYFIIIKPCWKQIKIKNNKTYFYDYLSRNKENKYIMLKTPK